MNLKKVLIGCGALLVVAAVAAGAVFWLVMRATAGPEEAVQGFLAAAAAEDWSAAHEYFSAPLKETQPLAVFSADATANSMFFKTTDTSFTERSVDASGARLAGTVTLESGTTVPAWFQLVREDDEWKLIGYNIGSSG